MTFADYLCGIEPAMLDFNTSTSQYRSIVEPPSVSEQQPVSGDRLPHVSDTQVCGEYIVYIVFSIQYIVYTLYIHVFSLIYLIL